MRVIIVGAGLAGLTCVQVLRERGAEVAVFEAPGGSRMRTDALDGSVLSEERAVREVF